MAEFWLNIDHVGFERMFVSGSIPGNDKFEVELGVTQRNMVEAFLAQQQQELQDFLMGLVT